MDELLVVLREIRDEMKHLNDQIETMNENIEAMSESIEDMQDQLAEQTNAVNGLKGFGLNGTLSDIHTILEDIKGRGTYDSITDLNDQISRLMNYVSNIEIHVTT